MASEQQKTTYTAAEVAVWEETILRMPLQNDSQTVQVRHPERSNPTPFPAVRQLGL